MKLSFLFYAIVAFAVVSCHVPKLEKNKTGFNSNFKVADIKTHIFKLNINSDDLEYASTISQDGLTLFFISNREGSVWNFETGQISHDIWAARRESIKDTNFYKVYNIDSSGVGINSPYNEGGFTLSSDSRTIYYTACNRNSSLGSCDLYKIYFNDNVLENSQNLGPLINSVFWESMPSIAPWSNRLYFISNRGHDNHEYFEIARERVKLNTYREYTYAIYYSDYNWETNSFKKPVPIQEINQYGDIRSVHISPDEKRLYFSTSDIPNSFGKEDLYYSEYNDSTKTWGTPINMGPDINTSKSELSISISPMDNSFFITRDFDIYMGYLLE